MMTSSLARIVALSELIFFYFRRGGSAAAPKIKNSECGKPEKASNKNKYCFSM